jgi:hypothetical protein
MTRQLWLAGLTAVLVAIGASPVADSALPAPGSQAGQHGGGLPECTAARPAGTAPTAPRGTPTCRARPTRVISTRGGLPRPVPGYHHLGATSGGEWSGILGRLTVRDAEVRAGTHDFVATRFMAKRQSGGRVSWLEAGWAETGWSGRGRQRIYTFDTNRNAWTFYDQYALRDGEQVWIYLHTEQVGGRTTWQAWLWWGGGWHLLTAEDLPLGGQAQVEQYVEVFVDPNHGGSGFPVPRIAVDNVQVKTAPDGGLRYWREEIPTAPGASGGRYCLDWQTRYDTWAAGDCPA